MPYICSCQHLSFSLVLFVIVLWFCASFRLVSFEHGSFDLAPKRHSFELVPVIYSADFLSLVEVAHRRTRQSAAQNSKIGVKCQEQGPNSHTPLNKQAGWIQHGLIRDIGRAGFPLPPTLQS